jgi:nicotinate-nucleotide adenylyltransferase
LRPAARAVAPRPGPGRRIGLLGGSFNPAHDGHRHISLVALRALALDQVWWLVSPQNPLKPAAGMAPLAERLARARAVAAHPRIAVIDLETRLGTQYTADTLAALRAECHGTRFVWLMGADNMIGFDRWRSWTEIAETVPIAVIDRPGYLHRALASAFARRYAQARVPAEAARLLPATPPPAWTVLRARLHPASATAIRARSNAHGPCSVSKARHNAEEPG